MLSVTYAPNAALSRNPENLVVVLAVVLGSRNAEMPLTQTSIIPGSRASGPAQVRSYQWACSTCVYDMNCLILLPAYRARYPVRARTVMVQTTIFVGSVGRAVSRSALSTTAMATVSSAAMTSVAAKGTPSCGRTVQIYSWLWYRWPSLLVLC